MALPRTTWIAVVILGGVAVGVGSALLRRPSAEPALDCPPERLRFRDGGEGPPLAYCGEGGAGDDTVPAGAALAMGKKLDLNRMSEADLALLPGVGPRLARTIVEARQRLGRFESWEDVDAIPGIGISKMELLRTHTELASDP